MFADVDDDVEVARGPAAHAGVAVAATSAGGCLADAGGDAELDAACVFWTRPSPWQVRAGIAIVSPDPPQAGQVCWTWKNPREAMTWPRPPQVGQVRVPPPSAAPEPLHWSQGASMSRFEFLLDAEGRFLERDLQVVAEVGPRLAPAGGDRRPAAATEEFLEDTAAAATAAAAEDLAEDVEGIVESAAADPPPAPAAPWPKAAWPKRS